MGKARNCCGEVLRGTAGIAKAMSGIDRPQDAEIDRRSAACRSCNKNESGKCKLCGCWVRWKVKIASESCPETPPRWNAVPSANASDVRPRPMREALDIPQQTGPRKRRRKR